MTTDLMARFQNLQINILHIKYFIIAQKLFHLLHKILPFIKKKRGSFILGVFSYLNSYIYIVS